MNNAQYLAIGSLQKTRSSNTPRWEVEKYAKYGALSRQDNRLVHTLQTTTLVLKDTVMGA